MDTGLVHGLLLRGPDRNCPLAVPPPAPSWASAADDYKRNGTTTLFAALEVLTGKVSASSFYQRHSNLEFVDFLGQVAKAHPEVELHVICDNYATHKHQNVKDWLAANPRVSIHFTPTSCSWLNMVEIFFGLVTRQAIRRGSFHSVQDLEDTTETYIAGYNDRAKPFRWVKPPPTYWEGSNENKSLTRDTSGRNRLWGRLEDSETSTRPPE